MSHSSSCMHYTLLKLAYMLSSLSLHLKNLMATKTTLALTIFLFILLALRANSAVGAQEQEHQQQEADDEDPELTTCKHQCKQQQQYSESDVQACIQRCEKYHRMKEEGEGEEEEEGQKIPRKEKEEEVHSPKEVKEDEDDDVDGQNPFLFEEGDFQTEIETEDGREQVLQKFNLGAWRSRFLQSIQNFRLATLEAKGHTFMSPCHFDSDIVIFNVQGKATIGLVKDDKTVRYRLERGDLMKVPAGTPVYLVNRDETEKLFLVKFIIPTTTCTPGEFQAFFGPGGRDPESFLTAFSWRLLEAALKSPRDKLEGLFKQQDKGSIFKLSKDSVKAVSTVSGWRIWPFDDKEGPFNLLDQRPYISNKHGLVFQTTPDEPAQLENLDLVISFTVINRGCMSAPLYMTKSTKICIPTQGKGHMEMVRPGARGQKSSSPSYGRFSAPLRPKVVFVVPPGHPFIIEATNESNLEILCFEINAKQNKMFTFAGKKNVVSALDDKVKELAFNFPAKKVDEIFSRDESFFFPGPVDKEDREGQSGRAYA